MDPRTVKRAVDHGYGALRAESDRRRLREAATKLRLPIGPLDVREEPQGIMDLTNDFIPPSVLGAIAATSQKPVEEVEPELVFEFPDMSMVDDVLIFPPSQLGPAGSATQSATFVASAKMLFKPRGIIISGCSLAHIAIDDVKVARDSQLLSNSGGPGGPFLPAEFFSEECMGVLPFEMDTCQANNQLGLNLRNLHPNEPMTPTVMVVGLLCEPDGGRAAAPAPWVHGAPRKKLVRARPLIFWPWEPTCEPGETIELTATTRQEYRARHLLLSELTASAFEVVDISTSTEQRPPRVCRVPRPGSLFATSSKVRLPLRLPTIDFNQSIVVTLRNTSDRPQAPRAVLAGWMVI